MPAGESVPGAIAIRVDGVSKRFDQTLALDDVSFDVHEGEVFGLLGPNGAGKTTLIRTILDLIRPDRGVIEILGRPFAPAVRRQVAYLPEERGLYARQSIAKTLAYLAALKGVEPAIADARAGMWLERFGLAELRDRRVEQLSKGNQQKVQLIGALMAAPAILVLDEPLSGLDPVSARLASRVILDCAAQGQTVLLSTHQMASVEALCSRVAMLAQGRRVLYGSLDDIKRAHSHNVVSVLSSADYAASPLVDRVDRTGARGGAVTVYLRDGASADEFLAWMVATRASVDSFTRLSSSLDDIFIRIAKEAGSAA